MFVHLLIAVAKVGKVHSFPPNWGFGFTHRLVFICMPVKFFVQWLHWLQPLQPPSTVKKKPRTHVLKDCMLIYAFDFEVRTRYTWLFQCLGF